MTCTIICTFIEHHRRCLLYTFLDLCLKRNHTLLFTTRTNSTFNRNNSIYNFLYGSPDISSTRCLLKLTKCRYDSICNTYLIKECGLHPPTSEQYGLIVHSHSNFFGSIAFPAVAELGLRVNKLGNTSVTWEIGLFEEGVVEVKAVGEMIHVFVERKTGRPVATGLSGKLREGLQRLLVPQEKL